MSIIKWKHDYTIVVSFILTRLLLIGFVNYTVFSNIMCLIHIASAVLLIVIWIDKLLSKGLSWGSFAGFICLFFEEMFGYEYLDSKATPLYEGAWKTAGIVGVILLTIIFCKTFDKSDRMLSVTNVVASLVVFAITFSIALSSVNIASADSSQKAEYEICGEGEYARKYKITYPVELTGEGDADFDNLSVKSIYEVLPGDKITIEYRNGIFYDVYKVVEIDPERFAEE